MFQNLRHGAEAFGRHQLTRMLVAEFQPCEGDLGLVVLALLLLVWRRARGEWRRQAWDNPVFFLAIIGWLLGFKVIRFWSDWGMPALAAWMAIELQDAIGRRIPRCHWGRVVLTVAAVGGLFLLMTQDAKGRWTAALTKEPLSATNPEHQPWLPEPGGILYSDSMQIFYDTFLENPYGQWRYMLGFEPTWMPADDLAVLHKIQWNMGAFKAFDGWVKKMRPEDRLVIQTDPGNQPKIKELEWHYAATNIWVGRLPRPAGTAPAPSPAAPALREAP
jgi:hypothetical protein